MSTLLEKKQNWRWWFLLPLYPYERRRTLVRELIPNQVWSFEQLQGLLYVAVPIRMTVIRLSKGLMLYCPIAPTIEVVEALAILEKQYGPVITLVLPTASGLEHKVSLPALSRAFPNAQIWVCPGQWSFPLQLPLRWVGIASKRTRILMEDNTPHNNEIDWYSLGPLDLGVGRFQEICCFHKASGTLLLTDSLVGISSKPPEIFDLDPTPLLFHGREYGDELLMDSSEVRKKGWARMVLFASYLRPELLEIRSFTQVVLHSLRSGLRHPHIHFGLYPFAWQANWCEIIDTIMADEIPKLQVAPVLERLVFPRARSIFLDWLDQLQKINNLVMLVPAHYHAPIPCCSSDIAELRDQITKRVWATDKESWSFLASLDRTLFKLGALPSYSAE
uniref:DUF4336 domain-containing protein n=1 Tax=Paulinella micropora TaxID=1928728 RepID=A0A385I1F8_9EUKA|nr:hypothetical protein PMNZ_848 [Paulinella micropora]AXY63763.1 hypothetical protein PMNZ_848 [Paulinella micropora]